MVELLPLEKKEDLDYIESLLREFQAKTGSLVAEDLLKSWPEPSKDFIKVILVLLEMGLVFRSVI